MVSKLRGISVLFICMLVLSACSSSSGSSEKKSNSKSKNKDLEVSIEDASFVLVGNGDKEVEGEDADKGILGVKFKLKNKSKEGIQVETTDGMKLYDGDNQENALSRSDYFNGELEIEYDSDGDLGAGKSKTVVNYFKVEKDKEYEIGINANSDDYKREIEEVIVKLDTSDYESSFDTIQDPGKALTAYIDMIYLDRDNNDYEKLVSADKAAIQEKAKKAFKDKVKLHFNPKLSDAEVDKLYANYKSVQAQKAKYTTTTSENVNGRAIVTLDASIVSLDSITSAMYEYESEYRKKTKEYNDNATKKYIMSKFGKIVDEQEINEVEGLKIPLIEEDGKWRVDTSESYGEYIENLFARGSKY